MVAGKVCWLLDGEKTKDGKVNSVQLISSLTATTDTSWQWV